MTDILHCAKCGEPLRVVCDAHGTEWVADRRINPVDEVPARAPTRAARKPSKTGRSIRREPVRLSERIFLAMLSADHVAQWRAADVARAFDISHAHASVELSKLAQSGSIVRVAVGQYALPGAS